MSTLRLGVHRLPAAEVVVIQTIVRLSAHDGAFPWKLVGVPPYDALLVDETTTEGGCPEAAAMARAVLTLTRMSSGDLPNTLERPIRAEKLQQWLKNTEREPLAAQPARPTTDEQTAMEMEVSDSVRFMLRRWHRALPALAIASYGPTATRAGARRRGPAGDSPQLLLARASRRG